MIVDDHPPIFPVSYIVDEASNIFSRTDSGTRLHAMDEVSP
ncbi:MAG TPA: hypothetical protein VGZ52_09240 [Acidimicrobiales bacterium]|nr:hypothetical protein [Acidimicrobiales bacterium]